LQADLPPPHHYFPSCSQANAITPGKRYPVSKEFALNTLRNRKTQFPAVTEHKAGVTEL